MSMKKGGKTQLASPVTPHRGEDPIDSSKDSLLEFVHSEEYVLGYTFFLIPDDHSFQLTKELVELLPEWLKQICATHGWKLEFVTVDPKYFEWAVSVHPAVSTGQIIQEVRFRLGEQIVLAFSEKVKTMNSVDFWAQGYLLLYGLHPQVVDIIEKYILLIRRQQQRH